MSRCAEPPKKTIKTMSAMGDLSTKQYSGTLLVISYYASKHITKTVLGIIGYYNIEAKADEGGSEIAPGDKSIS